MIIESVLALSLATGADTFTSQRGISKGFREYNFLLGEKPTVTKQALYSAAYVAGGTLVVGHFNKHYGKKSARVALGVLIALPIGAALSNELKVRKGR